MSILSASPHPDIDECSSGVHNCNTTITRCRNTVGSYECDLTIPATQLKNECKECMCFLSLSLTLQYAEQTHGIDENKLTWQLYNDEQSFGLLGFYLWICDYMNVSQRQLCRYILKSQLARYLYIRQIFSPTHFMRNTCRLKCISNKVYYIISLYTLLCDPHTLGCQHFVWILLLQCLSARQLYRNLVSNVMSSCSQIGGFTLSAIYIYAHTRTHARTHARKEEENNERKVISRK